MPELPEVETIVRGLANRIVGKTISRVEVRLPKMAQSPPRIGFARALRGQRVAGVTRRGKYALIALDSARRLVTSLRMTARLVVQRPREADYPGPTSCFILPTAPASASPTSAPSDACAWSSRTSRGRGARRRAPLLRLYTRWLCGYAVGADDAGQGISPRPAAHRRHWKYLCVRGAVGGSDPSGTGPPGP